MNDNSRVHLFGMRVNVPRGYFEGIRAVTHRIKAGRIL
jgi:hypothetical protein